MRKHIAYLLGVQLAVTSPVVMAVHGGGGMSHAGEMSAGHISTQGLGNTNGPNAADRDQGLDRAEDRMNAEGLEHNQAGKDTLEQQETDLAAHHGRHKGSNK